MRKFTLEFADGRQTVTLVPMYYAENAGLAVEIVYEEGEKRYLTINMPGGALPRNKAYINTYCLGKQIIDSLVGNEIGHLTGKFICSEIDSYEYLEFEFNEDLLKELNSQDYFQYLTWQDEIENGKVLLCPQCWVCGKYYPTLVTQKEREKYCRYLTKRNILIQDVFPDMDNTIRALFSQGEEICPNCWKEMFGTPPWEEDGDDIDDED